MQEGDKVLLKQQARDKLSTAFENKGYVVTEKLGNQVTIWSHDGIEKHRNSTFTKPLMDEEMKKQTEEREEEVMLSRPNREKTLPTRFKDFVLTN